MHEKRERAQKNAEDKQIASKNTISRLQKDFEEMSLERRGNDKQVEETKKQIEDIEKKVRFLFFNCIKGLDMSRRWLSIFGRTKVK